MKSLWRRTSALALAEPRRCLRSRQPTGRACSRTRPTPNGGTQLCAEAEPATAVRQNMAATTASRLISRSVSNLPEDGNIVVLMKRQELVPASRFAHGSL